MFPEEEFTMEAVSVPSNVSDQPLSNEETFQGAFNRAANARSIYPDAEYWVGIEGGISRNTTDMEAFAWVVIISTTLVGKARTATFFLPQQVSNLIDQGKELGDADDIVFGHSNSKQKNGAVGILTDNCIDRTSYYTEAVILALIPFKNTNLYKK